MINKFKIDGLAISLSFLCAVHCLFMPSFIILAPSLLSISFDNEFIHYLILALAIPISIFALSAGYKAHKSLSMIFIGFLGLSILLFAVLFGNNLFGEIGEKGLTLFGSVIVASAHYRNLKVCKELDCDCHDSSV
jgi:EamA domain-containing membrane protein RarD|tara:strand:- start:102 stop:506 length:405 start_codon:yes stop_codon:yes gene_type:complete